jgi:hypothetical protein
LGASEAEGARRLTPVVASLEFARSHFMKEYAELIQAMASLLWPIVTTGVIVYYRKEVKDLLSRIKRGKILGQEVELADSLHRLDQSVQAAASEVPLLTATPTEDKKSLTTELLPAGFYDPVEQVVQTAKAFPHIGLSMLSDLIDRELREIIFSQGEVDRPLIFTPTTAQVVLKKRNLLPSHLLRALRDFHTVRNTIVHARDQVSDAEVLRAVDSGVKILEVLQSIPRGIHVVHKPGVKLYSDAECKKERQGVSGVMLAMGDQSGPKAYHIYPTTRVDYREGEQVAWEWSHNNSWGQTWYRDPDSGEIKVAWSESMEFVGRPLYST